MPINIIEKIKNKLSNVHAPFNVKILSIKLNCLRSKFTIVKVVYYVEQIDDITKPRTVLMDIR